ncbi:hypothetical protein IFR05_008654 [Cadophora sp. M221]|nr:hypothetical protein IFR05_008654 [Cadophora sp. M221]
MVRVNAKSVFGKVDLDDAASIRRVMIAMDYTLSNSAVNFLAEQIQNLQGEERATTSVLQTTIRGQKLQGNDLLLRATLRFVEFRNERDEVVLAAAREFEDLADFDVFKFRVVYGKEYTAAEAKLGEDVAQDTYFRGRETLLQRAPGAFGNQGETSLIPSRLSSGNVPRPSSSLPRNPKRQKLSVPEPKVNPESETVPPTKKPFFTIVYRGEEKDLDEKESESESEYEPEPKERAIPHPAPKKQKNKPDSKKMGNVKTKPKPKSKSEAESSEDEDEDQSRISQGYADTPANRPVRLPGRRIIDNGNYDRKPAVAGEMDTSKLVLSFSLEKVDKKSGKSVPDGLAHFRYRHRVHWDKAKSVGKLQRWRAQNFGRHLGPVRGARFMWLESERDVLFSVLQDHLESVGGRWSRISWPQVTAAYNEIVAGTKQRAGELGAERIYNFKVKQRGKVKMVTNISKDHRLSADRLAPPRTHVGIRNQIKVFTHDTAKRIIDQAKEADRKARAKKRNSGKASPEPESPENSDHDEEYRDNGDAVEEGEEQDYPTMNTLLDDESSPLLEQDYINCEDYDDTRDEEFDADEPLIIEEEENASEARLVAEIAAAEENLITGARARAKDLAGSRWIRGG